MPRANPAATWALQRLPLILAALCLVLCADRNGFAQQSGESLVTYTDQKNLFHIAYPSSWRQAQSEIPYTVWSVDNGGSGKTRQTVSVRVYAMADSNYADPAEFVFQFLSGVEETGGLEGLTGNHPLKDVFPDVKAVEYGETTVGGASAFYILSNFTGQDGGERIPRSVMQLLTMRSGNVYELSYGASQAEFPARRPALAAIAATFAFD